MSFVRGDQVEVLSERAELAGTVCYVVRDDEDNEQLIVSTFGDLIEVPPSRCREPRPYGALRFDVGDRVRSYLFGSRGFVTATWKDETGLPYVAIRTNHGNDLTYLEGEVHRDLDEVFE